MSNPNNELVQTLLSMDLAVRQQYMDPGDPTTTFLGNRTMSMFRLRPGKVASGKLTTFQLKTRRSDSARSQRTPTEDFPDMRRMSVSALDLRFDAHNASLNDFHTIDAAAEIEHIQFRAGNTEAVAINLIDSLLMDFTESVNESWARLIHLEETGSIGTIDGTPKDADGVNYDQATSYGAGATKAIFKIAGFGADSLQPGMRIDAYSAAGALLADEMEVIGKNTEDNSVWVELSPVGGPNPSSVANLDSLADAAVLYRSKEKDKGMKSGPANWMAIPTAGESFIGGVDRMTTAYRWLQAQQIRPGATETTIKKQHLDAAFNALGGLRGRNEPGSTYTPTIVMHSSHEDALRQEIGEDAFTTIPANHPGTFNFGETRLTYQHPVAGQVVLGSDSLAPTNKVRIIIPEDWMKIPYGFAGLEFMPGEFGMFRQKPGASPGNGSKYLRAEAYEVAAIFCERPERQTTINAVTG